MTEVFLGVIAGAVAVMATIQVAAIVVMAKTVKRVGKIVGDLERDVRPIVTNLQALSADAARATALAAGQVDKADQLLNTLSKRVDDTVTSIQNSLVQPARDGMAILHGLKVAMSAFRDGGGGAPRKRPAAADDEELFIG